MEIFKCWANQKKIEECENNFITRNKSLLQEECIAFSKGENLHIHVFTAKEVAKMSSFTYDQCLLVHANFNMYRGTKRVDNQAICIKKFKGVDGFVGVEGIIREIIIAAQMSMHKNSLKLLGCCLETEFPIIVYELPHQGCLADHTIFKKQKSLPWKFWLKIMCDISYALAYLQNDLTSRSVVFRNFHSKEVFLDKDNVAKLSGYYFSVVIPEGENHVNDAIVSTMGYGAPEYITSGRLTEKTDVYCFGVFLLELLVDPTRCSGVFLDQILNKIKDDGKYVNIKRIVDPEISRDIKENGKQQQLQKVYDLALKSMASNEADRPKMVDVAVELKKMLESS